MLKESCNTCKNTGSGECVTCSLNYKSNYKPRNTKTCKGCRWNQTVEGFQVCWLPFKFGGDVHTVSAVTDATMRCGQYES